MIFFKSSQENGARTKDKIFDRKFENILKTKNISLSSKLILRNTISKDLNFTTYDSANDDKKTVKDDNKMDIEKKNKNRENKLQSLRKFAMKNYPLHHETTIVPLDDGESSIDEGEGFNIKSKDNEITININSTRNYRSNNGKGIHENSFLEGSPLNHNNQSPKIYGDSLATTMPFEIASDLDINATNADGIQKDSKSSLTGVHGLQKLVKKVPNVTRTRDKKTILNALTMNSNNHNLSNFPQDKLKNSSERPENLINLLEKDPSALKSFFDNSYDQKSDRRGKILRKREKSRNKLKYQNEIPHSRILDDYYEDYNYFDNSDELAENSDDVLKVLVKEFEDMFLPELYYQNEIRKSKRPTSEEDYSNYDFF